MNYGVINSLLEFYRRVKTTTSYYVPGHLTPATFDYIVSKNSKELIDFGIENKEWCYLTSFKRMFDRNNLKNIFSFIGCG